MDIVIEQVPEVLEQPQLQRKVTGRLEDAQEQPDLTATQEDLLNPIEPPPKRRGRPPGSKNKPRIIEQIPEEPIVLNEPPVEEPPPKKIKVPAPRKPRAPKAQPQAPPTTPHDRPTEAPVPQTPLQIAASMLEILRLEQAERQYRKGQLYKSWVKQNEEQNNCAQTSESANVAHDCGPAT